MKPQLSVLRFFTILALPLTLLVGCADKESADPAPATHLIQLRVTGTDLQDLDASVNVSSTRRADTPTAASGPGVFELYANSVSQTYDLGPFTAGDVLYGEVRLARVTPYDAVQPRSATVLTMEVLSDGKVVETLKLDATKAGPKIETTPFLRGKTVIKAADL
jgi:hypothetical protein